MQLEFTWCSKCGKVISDEEYVVNWDSCDECLDASIALYQEVNPVQPDLFDDGSQVYIW